MNERSVAPALPVLGRALRWAVLSLSLLLVGCGQTGTLYQPPPEEPAQGGQPGAGD